MLKAPFSNFFYIKFFLKTTLVKFTIEIILIRLVDALNFLLIFFFVSMQLWILRSNNFFSPNIALCIHIRPFIGSNQLHEFNKHLNFMFVICSSIYEEEKIGYEYWGFAKILIESEFQNFTRVKLSTIISQNNPLLKISKL